MSLGEIDAVRIMRDTIKAQHMTYQNCKKLSGIRNDTMEDLAKFYQQLEEK